MRRVTPKSRPPLPEPKLFTLTEDLRKRVMAQLTEKLTSETYSQADALLGDVASFGKFFYADGFRMATEDMRISDRLSEMVADYEVAVEKAQAQLRNLPVLVDQLVDELTQAIKVAGSRHFDLRDPAVADLEVMKEKLTQALALTDQLIATKKE